jgi:hypothetical protein
LNRKELQHNFHDQVNNTLEQLSMLSWDGNLSTSTSPPYFLKDKLAFYLSRRWLNDGHIDQLYSFLQAEVNHHLPNFVAEQCGRAFSVLRDALTPQFTAEQGAAQLIVFSRYTNVLGTLVRMCVSLGGRVASGDLRFWGKYAGFLILH